MVSLMVVVAPAGVMVTPSKLPPVVPVILTVWVLLSMNTSSVGAGTVTVPTVSPCLMVMLEPLSSWTSMSLPALLLKVAV